MRFPFPPAEAAATPADPAASVESETCEFTAESGESEITRESEVTLSAMTEAVDSALENRDQATLSDASSADSDPIQQEPEPRPRPVARAKRKIIAFPRPPAHVLREEEALLPERPRIMEVPEELQLFPATPLLDGLQFPSQEQQNAAPPADHIELPLQAIAVSRRLYAAVVDCAVVAVAAELFAAASYKLMPKLPLSKPLLLVGAAILVLLWAAYQYLFVMYGGRTLGMKVAGVRLSTFKGGFPRPRQRRSRLIGLYFSVASLMMGVLWALVDVDALCWHDRISKTYFTAQRE